METVRRLTSSKVPRIAIACQGGGSHTAFTAGVISRLAQGDVVDRHRWVGLSGTSGGAICALLSWVCLIEDRPGDAADLLERFWVSNSAEKISERFINQSVLWGNQIADYLTVPALSPYDWFGADWSADRIREMINSLVDVDRAQQKAQAMTAPPMLLLGAIEVMSGKFRTFDSRQGDISTEAILASTAIPTLFRSVPIEGGLYWDGLFSQNPPLRKLMGGHPDEIWIIQVNPTAIDEEPRTVSEITNRRNELSGNLSLYQEIEGMLLLDRLIERRELVSSLIRPVRIRILEMQKPSSSTQWGYASKLNRDPDFIRELLTLGYDQAEDFLHCISFERAWEAHSLEGILANFADGAIVKSDHPLARVDTTAEPAQREAFLTDMAQAIEINHNRMMHFGRDVRWEIRSIDGGRFPGHAEAQFKNGKIRNFSLRVGRTTE